MGEGVVRWRCWGCSGFNALPYPDHVCRAGPS
jgi:hypothetical protein